MTDFELTDIDGSGLELLRTDQPIGTFIEDVEHHNIEHQNIEHQNDAHQDDDHQDAEHQDDKYQDEKQFFPTNPIKTKMIATQSYKCRPNPRIFLVCDVKKQHTYRDVHSGANADTNNCTENDETKFVSIRVPKEFILDSRWDKMPPHICARILAAVSYMADLMNLIDPNQPAKLEEQREKMFDEALELVYP